MSLKIGKLEADIGADTTGLKKAEKEVVKSTSNIDKSLKKTEKAAKDTGKKGFKPMGRNAGQAGIQVQQLVGQLQGGTSAFVAISQQAADFGIVLGAPMIGVIVSLSAVLAGVLFNALQGSADAADKAATSASDLSKEYLKLTGQTEALKAVNISQSMVTNTEAIAKLSKEFEGLTERRDNLILGRKAGVGPGVGKKGLKLITELSFEVAEFENKIASLNMLNEEHDKFLKDFFKKGIESTLEGPQQPEGQSVFSSLDEMMEALSEEIAVQSLRSKLFSDTNAGIEAEILRFQLAALTLTQEGSDQFLDIEQALADKRVELHDKVNEKIAASDKRAADKLERAADKQARDAAQNRQLSLNSIVQLGDQINGALEGAGKEGTAIAKAIFLAQKAIHIATILTATEAAAANAGVVASAGGYIPFFATVAAIRAVGFASAGVVAGTAIAGFEQGGILGGSSFSGDNLLFRGNSGEMVLNQRQQQRLFSIADRGSQTSGSPTAPAITIINEGTPKDFEVQSITREEVVLIARDQANSVEDRINASLSTGRGRAANSVRGGFDISRNINSQR